MSIDVTIPNYGYAIEKEDIASLEANGADPMRMMAVYADTFPKFDINANPLGLIDILNQGGQGACAGHSLASIFQVCFFLATGRKASFSRAAGYYLSQKASGIRGDNGATLDGCRKVATGSPGLCLAEDWEYPERYNNSQPPGIKFEYKLVASKPLRTVADVNDWIDAGLPIQTGMAWNSTCEREVVNAWKALARSGGHSTYFWQRNPETGNIRMPNSWRFSWMQDGMNEWTEGSIAALLKHQHTVLIGYAPDGMSFPAQEPIS